MVLTEAMPGLSIDITVGGNAVKEYEDRDFEEDDRTITRFIEASSGQSFAIALKLDPKFRFKGDCLKCDIFVDGKHAVSVILVPGSRPRIVEGAQVTASLVAKFRFAGLETVADGRVRTGEAEKCKDLGVIRIKCSHKIRGREEAFSTLNSNASKVGIVSEKALKGGSMSHSVDFDEPALVKSRRTISVHPVRGEPEFGEIIIFHYRSMAALKSMLIVPRTPTPPPLHERDPATLNPDELQELMKMAQKYHASTEAKVKVKRERTDDNPRPRKVAKAYQGDTLLEFDDGGSIRERSETLPPQEKVVIEID